MRVLRVYFFVSEIINIILKTSAQLCNIKKMRSTHACTPTFATFRANIHVGCCLFSHINKTKNNVQNQWCGHR